MLRSHSCRKKYQSFSVSHNQTLSCISLHSFSTPSDTFQFIRSLMVFRTSVPSHMLSPLSGIPFYHLPPENSHHLRINSSITSSGKFLFFPKSGWGWSPLHSQCILHPSITQIILHPSITALTTWYYLSLICLPHQITLFQGRYRAFYHLYIEPNPVYDAY